MKKSRITKKFEALAKKNKKAFIGFLEAGDPTIEKTEELVLAMEKGGADIIEIGIPYSDPLADGIEIQKAALRAFANGINLDLIFEGVTNIREKTEIPLLFLVYYSTVFRYGVESFIKKCSEIGIDGLIIPDLPLEEREEVLPYNIKYGVDLIPLVAPTSKDRIKAVIEGGAGFVYCVSSMGVTGVRNDLGEEVGSFLSQVKAISELPIAVGFGIATSKDVKEFSIIADGVIVGSAIVKVIGETQGDLRAVSSKVQNLKGDI